MPEEGCSMQRDHEETQRISTQPYRLRAGAAGFEFEFQEQYDGGQHI